MNITKTINNQKLNKLKTIIAALLLLLASGLKSEAQKIHVGLIYPISSNGVHAPLDTNDFSINLIAGVSSVEKGFSFAGVSSIVRNNTYGTQFAGFSNHIGKTAKGALFAGFANIYRQNDGVAFAGFANIAHGNVKGAQFAGFSNIAKEVKGVQFAGFLNVAGQLKGSQLAGFTNVAKDVSASQLAGFSNKARDVKGSQLAGFINVARKVKGAQIAGFMNVADSSDCPIGILNFIKNGEKSIGLSIDENQTTMLTFRSGGKILYGILGAGYNFKNNDEVYAFEAGFGAHFLLTNSFRINTELTASSLSDFRTGEYFRASFKLLPALKITKHIELFGGPSLNLSTTNTVEGKALNTKNITTWQGRYTDYLQTLSVGYGGGIQVLF